MLGYADALIRGSMVLGMMAWLSPCHCRAAQGTSQPTRNAVFNGDFVEGVTGWSVLGPGHAAASLAAEKSQHAQILINDLVVRCPGMRRSFTVYSPYLLQVKPGCEYLMRARASGEGQFVIGAIEYDETGNHIGNNYSDRRALGRDLEEFAFTYKPSAAAIGMRPAIVFLEATDGAAMDVNARLRGIEMPIPVDDFDTVCSNWPDYAKDVRFADSKGFSAAELAEIEDVGHVDAVLPPYKPILMNEPGDFTLTTAQVRFDQTVFPGRVSILGQEILAGPIALSVELDDGTRLDLHAEKPVIQSTGTRATLRQEFRSGGEEMAVRLDMDYDALLVYTVSFPRRTKRSIARATLSIPLRPEVGKYIRYTRSSIPMASGVGDWVFGYGPIPGKGEHVETRATIGSVHMGGVMENDWKPAVPDASGVIWEWNRGFLHTLCIGDETRGLSVMSPSTEGYRAGKDDATVRLTRTEEDLRLAYGFITDKAPPSTGRTFRFALQFMPPKPIPRSWVGSRFNPYFSGYSDTDDPCLDALERSFRSGARQSPAATTIAYSRDHDLVKDGVIPGPWAPGPCRPHRDIGFLWFTLWSQGSNGWKPGAAGGGCGTPLVGQPERLRRLVKCSDLLGHLGLPYLAATHIAAEDPAGYFHVEKTDEWTQHPRIPRAGNIRPTCPNSLFSNYIARGVGRLIDEYGISGVYFDNCAPMLCQNRKHGCGYVDEHGTLRPTLPLLGFRKLFKMVRHEFVRRGKEPFILTHANLHPAAVSFTDVELDGEGTYGSDHTRMISLGEWRSRWLGPNQYGVQLSYLTQFGYGLGPGVNMLEEERIGTPRLLAMSLLHGTQVWAQYVDASLLYRTWAVLDELDESDSTFVPYWQWPEVNEILNAKGVYATAYSDQDRLLLVLSNLTDEERTVAVPMAGIHARNASARGVADHLHGQPVRIEAGTLRCTIAPKNFRLLSFTR